jgi:prepilin-type N-terminal cleavage/methylation domain-containing protein
VAASLGFTLLELLVVMVIGSLTVGLVFTGIESGSKRSQETEFVQAFASGLKRTRLAAGRSGRPEVFLIRPEKKLCGPAPKPGTRIPANVEIFAESVALDPDTGEVAVVFNPDGSANEREFQIRFDKSRDFRIHVHPLFGTVRWERKA